VEKQATRKTKKDFQKIVDAVFERIRKNYKEIFGLDSIPTIERLNTICRPRSLVLKVNLCNGSTGRNYFVKIFQFPDQKLGYEKMAREYRVLKALNEQNHRLVEFDVIFPIACFEDLQAIVTEEFSGQAFSHILKHGTRFHFGFRSITQIEQYCQFSGRWLSHFQKESNRINGRPYSHSETVIDIHAQVTNARERGFLSGQIYDQVREHVERVASEVCYDIPISGMHSDFIPSNILVGDRNVTVLDFADFRKGPIYRDVITMLHALDNYCWNPLVRVGTIRSLQSLFLSSYGTKIRKQDIPLVSLLEIRQALGEILSLSHSMRNQWLLSPAYRLALHRLTKRLSQIIKNWRREGESYTICGVEWGVDDHGSK
jgi:tRNA A-37 threonylcarbamoyl transferase component Bud32